MSGRALDLTQRQIRALCEGARKAGFVPVMKVGVVVVTLLPEEQAIKELGGREVDREPEISL